MPNTPLMSNKDLLMLNQNSMNPATISLYIFCAYFSFRKRCRKKRNLLVRSFHKWWERREMTSTLNRSVSSQSFSPCSSSQHKLRDFLKTRRVAISQNKSDSNWFFWKRSVFGLVCFVVRASSPRFETLWISLGLEARAWTGTMSKRESWLPQQQQQLALGKKKKLWVRITAGKKAHEASEPTPLIVLLYALWSQWTVSSHSSPWRKFLSRAICCSKPGDAAIVGLAIILYVLLPICVLKYNIIIFYISLWNLLSYLRTMKHVDFAQRT